MTIVVPIGFFIATVCGVLLLRAKIVSHYPGLRELNESLIEQGAYVDTLPRFDELGSVSKGELAERLFPQLTYDTALPQPWINEAVEVTGMKYSQLLSTVVYLYPPEYQYGIPAALTRETYQALNSIGYSQWEGR